MTLQQLVGKNIRKYRKMRCLTLQQLADRIYKSKSILSRYELGESIFDIDTLYLIANALQIEPTLLLPVVQPKPAQRIGLFATDMLHCYCIVKSKQQHLIHGTLSFLEQNASAQVSFCLDPAEGRKGTCYEGDVVCHPDHILFTLTNTADQSDQMVFSSVIDEKRPCVGIALTKNHLTGEPAVTKILFSKNPLSDQKRLYRHLKINWDDITTARQSNVFGVSIDDLERAIFPQTPAFAGSPLLPAQTTSLIQSEPL